jgi:hypothetical protein
LTEGFGGEDNVDSAKLAIVDNVDRTSWAQSSIGKVCNVNKEDKEEKVYR